MLLLIINCIKIFIMIQANNLRHLELDLELNAPVAGNTAKRPSFGRDLVPRHS
jgi:hypothetical protein